MRTADVILADNGSSAQSFGMSFPFFGTDHRRIFVGANGYLTFGSDGWSRPDLRIHFSRTRIAGFFNDLDPSDPASGAVTFDEYTDHITVTFDDVVSTT